MQLIRKIRVKYFRSVYMAVLNDCRDLTIISGANDVGKSNILKALNLFFSEQTDWGIPLAFTQDFSKRRLQQVQKESVKGRQFISVAIEFSRPPNYQNSLPEHFWVTRTWFREPGRQESDNLDALGRRGQLPSTTTTATARRFLSQFLNRIHFEYVPAVRERTYYLSLLSNLQTRILSSPGNDSIARVASTLAANVQTQIEGLSAEFKQETGLDTIVVPPTEIASLFRPFDVSTSVADVKLPLALRGDGIQARYIPSVLHYIAERSKDFFVWGFEEPENSLEYSLANALAHKLEDTYSQKAQILVTSHSPAILSLRGANSVTYRAYTSDSSTNLIQVWPTKKNAEQDELLKRELGYYEINKELNEHYAQLRRDMDNKNEEISKLKNVIREAKKPLVLVEGKFDKEILETTWSKLYPTSEAPFVIHVADSVPGGSEGGAAGAGSVKKMIEAVRPEEGKQVVGLFDRDDGGNDAYCRLDKNFVPNPKIPDTKVHKNGLSFALQLPTPVFRTPYAVANNLPIEFMFPDEVIARKTNDGRGLKVTQGKVTHVVINSKRIAVPAELVKITEPSFEGYAQIQGGKDVFAKEIVPSCTADEYQTFHPLFETICVMLEVASPFPASTVSK